MKNNFAINASENFNGTWPYKARYLDAPDFKMHYIDEGSGPETLVLLHGEPTWSYLFRQQIKEWSKRYRVIAVDHMGFGKSESPPNKSYWLQDHVDNLEHLVLALNLKNITLVMHDFGGPVGLGFAIRRPERVKQFISINGPTPAGQHDLIERIGNNVSKSPWFQWILKAEEDGSLETVLGQLNYNILSTMKLNGFERNEIISNDWITAYASAFPSPKYAKGAIGWAKGFATNEHYFAVPSPKVKNEISQKPAMAIWGLADKTLHADEFLPLFEELFQNGIVHKLPGVGHYSPEDAPSEITKLVINFLEHK